MLEYVDLLNAVFGSYVVGAVSWLLYKIKTNKTRPSVTHGLNDTVAYKHITHVTGPGPDKVYVRFNFVDGRTEVRKFYSTDLDLILEWRGRVFEAGEWTPDGHVYREVIS